MNDAQLERLLEQYHNGSATPEELAQLNEWYDSLKQTDRSFFLPGTDKEAYLSQFLEQVQQHINITPVEKQKPLYTKFAYRWVAAAALVVLVATGGWLLLSRQQRTDAIVVQAGTTTVTETTGKGYWKTEHNRTRQTQTFSLPDGSVAKLSAGATLQYQMPFADGVKRELRMQGQVYFNVAKDKARPFTVYAGGLATTALGTSFTITAQKEELRVLLLTGKVVVQKMALALNGWQGDVFLMPGQQMQYNVRTAKVSVSDVTIQKETREQLVFNDTPLPQVFEKLKKQYNVSITYNAAELRDMYFSGSIQPTDAVAVLLKAIAQMNGLTVTPVNNGFVVQMTP